jgi:hypothetical protein
MQHDASDNYLVRGGSGGLREGSSCNSQGLLERDEAVIRLRQVSELRACLRDFPKRLPIPLHSCYVSGHVQVRGLQCYAVKLLRHGMKESTFHRCM